MTTIYNVIDTIKQHLREHPIVNTVTFGNVLEVGLDKTTIYPLSHFELGPATVESNVINVTLQFLFLDILDKTNEYDGEDLGGREDKTNLIDIYNTQLQIANDLISHLRRGDLHADKFHLVGDPVCNPFRDRFENELAGWAVSIDVQVPNNISVC